MHSHVLASGGQIACPPVCFLEYLALRRDWAWGWEGMRSGGASSLL